MHASVTLWGSCLVLLAACAACGRGVPLAVRPGGLAVSVFALLLVSHTLFLSPAYSVAGVFHPLVLLFAYWALRAQAPSALPACWLWLAGVAGLCALWALLQVGPLGLGRGQAMLEAPATLGAFLNLATLPVLVWLGCRGPSAGTFLAAIVLSGGVAAAASRGAWMGLIAGLGVALLLAQRTSQGTVRRNAPYPVLAVGAGWALSEWMRFLPWQWMRRLGLREDLGLLGALQAALPPPSALLRGDSSSARLELYALAIEAWQGAPWTGSGYLTFTHALERARASVPAFGLEQLTWFVHNDYLQILQELGVAGLLAMLALVVVPPLRARMALPSCAAYPGLLAIAACAGMASMAVHALVDFPFYVPACLLAFGGLLGALDRVLCEPTPGASCGPATRRFLRLGAGLAIIVACLPPLVSELSLAGARQALAAAQPQRALYWLEVARRFQPRDWRYHWYLGQFWQGQARAGGKRDAARYAVEAFDAGERVNAAEVRNLLGKLATYRDVPALLEPVPASTRLDWLHAVLARAPLSGEVRLEQGLTLAALGQAAEARRVAAAWLRAAPDDPRAQRLARQLGATGGR